MRSCWGRTTSPWKTQDSWAGLLLYHFLFFTLLLSLWEPSLLSMFVICCLFVCFLVCFHNKILETTRILVFPLLRVTTIDWDASCHFVLLLLSLLGTFSLLSEVFVVVFVFFPIRFAFYNFLTTIARELELKAGNDFLLCATPAAKGWIDGVAGTSYVSFLLFFNSHGGCCQRRRCEGVGWADQAGSLFRCEQGSWTWVHLTAQRLPWRA